MYRYDILAMSVVDCPLCEVKIGDKCKRVTKEPRLKGRVMQTVHHERRHAAQEWRRKNPVEYKERLKSVTEDPKKHTRTKHSASAFERDK